VQSLRELGDGHVSWESVYEAEDQERRRLQSATSAGVDGDA